MTRTRRLQMFAIALLVISACDDPTDLPRPLAPFTATPSALYAGSELKIIGTDATRLADIWLQHGTGSASTPDSVGLEILRRNADTIVVRVASTARSGEYVLRTGGHLTPLASVTVAGFRETRAHTTAFECNLDVLGSSVASIIGTRRNALVKVLPATGAIQELIPASHLNEYQYAIGRSYRSEIVFVIPSGQNYEVWNIAAGAELVDTLPYNISNALHQINDSVFISTRNNSTFSYKLRDAGFAPAGSTWPPTWWREYHDPWGALISPRGDFGLVLYNYAPSRGQPVFDGVTGLPRYHIPIEAAYYARFSASTDTIYMVGNDGDTNLLLAIDPQNGAELARLEMGEATFENVFHGLAVDAFNHRLFVAMRQDDIINLHIIDSRTLEPVARMQGAGATSIIGCAQLVFDNSGIYVVDSDRTYSFDYLP